MQPFTHLHLHSEYSLLDGANRIGPLLDRIKALGMDSCAITDHGVMYGVVDFYQEAKKRGINPVIGCEIYTCEDMDEKRSAAREYSHLILLCENNTGYENLIKIVSEGFTRGFYYKPRVDMKLLAQHTEGLIAMSACLSGDLPKMLLNGHFEKACAYALKMQELFGKGNYFIELMDHGIADEKRVLPLLVKVSRETGIPLVVTNDCHYLLKEDAHAQEVLMCIQTGKTLQDENRMRMDTTELYVKSPSEMAQLFPQHLDALTRTHEIAQRCHVEFDFNTIHLPVFPVPEGKTAQGMLRELCVKGVNERYGQACSEALERLDYELDVISSMGYIDYFLIVWDFINYSRENGIEVGPGRGSAAGSIVAYSLGITALDPLKYNLLFERFLNPERVSMPDIDIDFCYERRQEVIDYVARRYGQDHVAQIITFGTMAARAVVRDVGRAMGYPYGEVDAVAKLIPMELNITLERALSISADLRNLCENDERVKALINTSRTLEGMPRHASTHAAGVLITKKPVTDYVPLQKNDEVITTQYPMGTLERLGLLKMDFLGLRTLTVIRDTVDLLADSGVKLRVQDIPIDDKAIYDMISAGETVGVFQLESSGMTSFLSNMKPQCFEDIIAAISLYRPGPMDSIPRYIECKNDASKTTYLHPKLEPILSVTYGCMVYQEQVMQIVRDLAGYSYGRSDLVRRAMAKKKHDVMAQEREYFIHGMTDDEGNVTVPGCVRNGVPADIASKIFDEMTAFASYAFNKSHAAAYGVVAAQTGYLKAHYPVEFFAAMLNSVSGNATKIALYAQYCRKHDIPFLPPSINESVRKFSVGISPEGKRGIRFGLGALKGCGDKAIDAIIRERQAGGPYRDIYDFCRRVDSDMINKRVVESLIKSGAFDMTGARRVQLMAVFEGALDGASRTRKANVQGQMSLFGGDMLEDIPPTLPDLREYPLRVLLAMEKEVTGVYISGHPLDEYAMALSRLTMDTATIDELREESDHGMTSDQMAVRMGGMIVDVRQKATRKGDMMAFAVLEDLTGQIEMLVFPRVYERYGTEMMPDTAVSIEGRLSIREDEEPKLIVQTITPLLTDEQAKRAQVQPDVKQKKLYLKLSTKGEIDAVSALLTMYRGAMQVVFFIADTKVTLRAPANLSCVANRTLLDDLSAMLGTEAVVVK